MIIDRSNFIHFEYIKEELRQKGQKGISGAFIPYMSNFDVKKTFKVSKRQVYNRPFFVDYMQEFQSIDTRLAYRDNYHKISSFFKNLRFITMEEIENFLLFFGATHQIITDKNFLKRLIFFFGLLCNNFQIHCLFYYRDVYELYYLFSSSFVTSEHLVMLAEWFNNKLLSNEKIILGKDFTGEAFFLVENFFEFFYEILNENENKKFSLISRMQWSKRAINNELFKIGFSNRFFLVLYVFNNLLKNHFLQVVGFSFKFYQLGGFMGKKKLLLKFFIYKFFYKYKNEFLGMFEVILKSFHKEEDYAVEFTNILEHFRFFIIFLIRLYKKFLFIFFYFFSLDRARLLVNLYLKIFSFLGYKYTKFFKIVVHLSRLFKLDLALYAWVFRKYIYKDFEFFFFNSNNRVDLLISGSSVYTAQSLVPFIEVVPDLFGYFYSINFLKRKFYFYFLYRYKLVMKYMSFFSPGLMLQFLHFFSSRTKYKYEFVSMGNRSLGLFKFSYIDKFFKMFSLRYNRALFLHTFNMIGSFDFVYVPVSLRVASVIEDFFDLVSEETVVEGLDKHLEFSEDFYDEFYQQDRLEAADNDNEEGGYWYHNLLLSEFESDDFVFPEIYDDFLSVDLFANVSIYNTYPGFSLLNLRSDARSVSVTDTTNYFKFLKILYGTMEFKNFESDFEDDFVDFDLSYCRYWLYEYYKTNSLITNSYVISDSIAQELELRDIVSVLKPEYEARFASKKSFSVGERAKNRLYDLRVNMAYEFLASEARIVLKKAWVDYENDKRHWEFFWSNYLPMFRLLRHYIFDFLSSTSFEIVIVPAVLLDVLQEITLKTAVTDGDRWDVLRSPVFQDIDNELAAEVFTDAEARPSFFYHINNLKEQTKNAGVRLMDPRLLFRNGFRVHATYSEQYFAEIYSSFTEYSAFIDEDITLDDGVYGETEYIEKFFDSPSNTFFQFADEDAYMINDKLEGVSFKNLAKRYQYFRKLGAYATRRFGFGRPLMRFVYFSDYVASEDFFTYLFRCFESTTDDLTIQFDERYHFKVYSKNDAVRFINAGVFFTAPSVIFTNLHGLTIDKFVFGVTSLGNGIKTVPLMDKRFSNNRNLLFFRFLCVFSSTRGVLVQLSVIENSLFFFLRFFNYTILCMMFEKIKDDGYFIFFLMIWPGIYWYFLFFVYFKFFNGALQMNHVSLDNFVEVFFSLLLGLSKTDSIKFIGLFFKFIVFFLKFFIRSIKSFYNRCCFLKKYNKILRLCFLNNLGVYFVKLLGCSFKNSIIDEHVGVLTALRYKNVLGNYDLVFSQKMHPSLRNYVSTLVGYFTDDYLLFRFLNNVSFLQWLRGDSGKFELSEGVADEINMQLEQLRNKFLQRSSLLVRRLNNNSAYTVSKVSYYDKIMDKLNVSAVHDKLSINFFELESQRTLRYKYDKALAIEAQVTDYDEFIGDEDEDNIRDYSDADDDGFDDDYDYDEWYHISGDDEFSQDDSVDLSSFEDFTFELDVEEPSTSLLSDIFEVDDFNHRRIFYPRAYRFLFVYYGWLNIMYSKFRDYIISIYEEHHKEPKKQIFALQKIFGHNEQMSFDMELNKMFFVNYALNNAVIKSVYQIDNLHFLDMYIQPRFAGDDYDSELYDISEVSLDFFSPSEGPNRHFFFKNTIGGINFHLLNYSLFEIKRNRIRLLYLLMYEYGNLCFKYIKHFPDRLWFLELEERLLHKIFTFYNFGFFARNVKLYNLVFYKHKKLSIFLFKYVVLSVRRYIKNVNFIFSIFLEEYLRFNINEDRLSFLTKKIKEHEFLYIGRQNQRSRFYYFILDNMQFLVNLCDFMCYNNIKFCYTFSDLLLYSERLLLLKGLFPGELSFFGYFLLVRELLIFLENFPVVSKRHLWLKMLDFKNRIKMEEFCFFKYNYNLYQVGLRYGISEALYFFEANLKNELFLMQVRNVPRSIHWFIFFEEFCMFLVYFFFLFFFFSDFFESLSNVVYVDFSQPDEDPDERWMLFFPTAQKLAVSEFYTVAYPWSV